MLKKLLLKRQEHFLTYISDHNEEGPYHLRSCCHIQADSYHVRCTMCDPGVVFQMAVIMPDVQCVTMVYFRWQWSCHMYKVGLWCHISDDSDHVRCTMCDHGVIFQMAVTMLDVQCVTVVSCFRWQWSCQMYNVWPWIHIYDFHKFSLVNPKN